jgi:hypothetical protein
MSAETELAAIKRPNPLIEPYLEVWRKITALFDLKSDNERRRFLRMRLGETPEQFNHRVSQSTYTPILPDTIRDLAKKIGTGEVVLSQPIKAPWFDPDNHDFWLDMAVDLARDTIAYGRSLILIDGVKGPMVISPTQCLNFGNYSDGSNWFVIHSSGVVSKGPFETPTRFTEYNLIDNKSVTKYVEIAGEPVRKVVTSHGFGVTPVLDIFADDELFTGAAAVDKAIQHYRLENVLNEAANLLYIQRTIRPPITPDSDLGDTYEFDTGNEHIITGDFTFSEPSGTSIKAGLDALEDIRNDIRNIISLGSLQSGTGLSQSGVARRYDYHDYSLTVAQLGNYVITVLNQLARLITECYPNNEGLSFSGLSTFQVDNLEYFVAVAESLIPHREYLSPSALQRWYSKIDSHLLR